jgi:23S rRNA pseudouridine1911/1915/1917 synthase
MEYPNPHEEEEIDATDEGLDEEQQELYEHYRFVADPKQSALRIDLYLMDRIEYATRNKVQNAIHAGLIKVNGEEIKPNYRVKPGDVIVVYWMKPRNEQELVPEDIPLDVRYEDDDLMVIYKPAGLVAHPAVGHYRGTIANALAFRFREMPLLNNKFPDRPGLVHRIDKNTTGLLLIAKSDTAMTHLAKQFFDHTVYRRYVALVWGDLKQDEGTITAHIGRDPNFRKLRCVVEKPEQGKYAVTHYKVLRRFGYVTLIECRLETGRTHQIRVHLKHIGHPLFSDFEYGGDRIVSGTVYPKYRNFVMECFETLPHQALHARALGFMHPSTGDYMQFEADIPDYFQQTLDLWEKYVSGRLSPERYTDI